MSLKEELKEEAGNEKRKLKEIPYCRCHRRHFPDLYHRHQYLQFHQGNHGLLCCGQ